MNMLLLILITFVFLGVLIALYGAFLTILLMYKDRNNEVPLDKWTKENGRILNILITGLVVMIWYLILPMWGLHLIVEKVRKKYDKKN
jgi:heme/copper-type cytochrome/quinol oxidase subunit 2